jgi:hypothetical protein
VRERLWQSIKRVQQGVGSANAARDRSSMSHWNTVSKRAWPRTWSSRAQNGALRSARARRKPRLSHG